MMDERYGNDMTPRTETQVMVDRRRHIPDPGGAPYTYAERRNPCSLWWEYNRVTNRRQNWAEARKVVDNETRSEKSI